MRILLVTTVILALLMQQGYGQEGFFNGLRNLFRPRRQNQFRNNRPQPPRFQQPQQPFQQSFQPQQQQFNQFQQQPQQQQFNQFQQQPQQQQQPFRFNQQQQFSGQSNQFIGNNAQRPAQQTVFRNNQAQVQTQQQTCPKPNEDFTRSQEPEPFCADAKPNHVYNGRNYILTWLNGCEKFTGQQAEAYCARQGGHALSMDTEDKVQHFFGVAAQFAKRYYWTGGRINHQCGKVIWPSQRQEGWVRGTKHWSHTGGSEDKGPQPDNRDKNEICLAVLNNFYADGIKWHDVACHHRKPTICEL